MAEEKKKPITATNKTLIYLVAASWLITLILFLSGFRKINFFLLAGVLLVIALLIYYFIIKKPKVYDVYRMIDELNMQHYKKLKLFLDTRDFQVIPAFTPSSAWVHLPREGITAYFDNGKLMGIENNHIYRVLRRQEKSKLFLESLRYLGAESKLKHAAESLNVDLASLGLE